MKRRDLERKIRGRAHELGLSWTALVGANHDLFSLDGLRVSIPRHTEIPEPTAEAILKHTEQKLGMRWWR